MFFNDILHAKMPFYNLTLGQEQVQSIIADCTRSWVVARRSHLLDRIKDLGFRESTRSGLSFAIDDLNTAPSEAAIIALAEKSKPGTIRNADFREGLSMLEYFSSTRRGKGLIERAVKTARSRRLGPGR